MDTGLGRIVSAGLIRNSLGVAGAFGPNMRVLNYFALVYTLEGEAFYRDTEGTEQLITAGDLIVVFPDLGHTYGPRPGKTWSEYNVIFEGGVFELWRRRRLLTFARPVYHLEPVDYWYQKLQSISDPDPRPQFDSSVQDVCRLQLFLAEALQSDRAGMLLPGESDWVARVCSLLEKDGARKRSMPAVAKGLKMSYENFRKRFTRIVGMSPARYRDTRIIHRACRLMQETNLSNKEIAYQLGFADECHFSHRFKQLTGRSPLQFRKAIPVIPGKKIPSQGAKDGGKN